MSTRFVYILVLIGLISPIAKSGKFHEDDKEIATWSRVGRGFVSNKRGLLELALMIDCKNNRGPVEFIDYGCWCGHSGNGTPVDELDSCCRAHDMCYKTVRLSTTCLVDYAIYLVPYSQKQCTICEPASYYWYLGECRYFLCECDATAAKCFAKYEAVIIKSLKITQVKNVLKKTCL